MRECGRVLVLYPLSLFVVRGSFVLKFSFSERDTMALGVAAPVFMVIDSARGSDRPAQPQASPPHHTTSHAEGLRALCVSWRLGVQ